MNRPTDDPAITGSREAAPPPRSGARPIRYYHRYTAAVETEAVYGEGFLRFAYGNPLGRLSVFLFARRAWFSAWYGWRMNRPASRARIRPFVERYGLDAGEFVKALDEFEHFNDFFARELKPEARPIRPESSHAVFPADGRHLGFQDLGNYDAIYVKGQRFDLRALLRDDASAERYRRGTAVLSRLCPIDYHRFHFPAAGRPEAPHEIPGPLYSVNPLALRKKISFLWRNKRTETRLAAPSFGTITLIEFGATNVGSIRQLFPVDESVAKGQLKGCFRFGGSAVMTLFEPGRVELAADLREQTARGRELYARMGDTMGVAPA